MKALLLISTISLLTVSVYAQDEMPRQLTCTERAFNFSISLGSGLKLSTPKMGPVEVNGNEGGYTPAWALKVIPAETSTYSCSPTSFQQPANKQTAAGWPYGNGLYFSSQPKALIPTLKLIRATGNLLIPSQPLLVGTSK